MPWLFWVVLFGESELQLGVSLFKLKAKLLLTK